MSSDFTVTTILEVSYPVVTTVLTIPADDTNVATAFPFTTTFWLPDLNVTTTLTVADSVATAAGSGDVSSQASSAATSSSDSNYTSCTVYSGSYGYDDEQYGVDVGTAAGIGIGAAFAGALIALVASCLFFRRSKRKDRRENAYSSDKIPVQHSENEEMLFDTNKTNMFITTDPSSLDGFHLDRTDDSQIRKSMQDLNDLISQHVANHYNLRTFQGRHVDLEREILRCGYSDHSVPTAQTLVGLIVNPITRRPALRQLISRVILRSIELGSEDETRLLPVYVLAASQALLGVNKLPDGEQG